MKARKKRKAPKWTYGEHRGVNPENLLWGALFRRGEMVLVVMNPSEVKPGVSRRLVHRILRLLNQSEAKP